MFSNYQDLPMSQHEVIDALQNVGIEVRLKPVAIFPVLGHEGIYEEMDIYDAYKRLCIRASITRDPFSD